MNRYINNLYNLTEIHVLELITKFDTKKCLMKYIIEIII